MDIALKKMGFVTLEFIRLNGGVSITIFFKEALTMNVEN